MVQKPRKRTTANIKRGRKVMDKAIAKQKKARGMR